MGTVLGQAAPRTRDEAVAYCRQLTGRHYENFSVASWLLPRALRPHVSAIYTYCRTVDDLGDEEPGDRSALLDLWEEELERCFAGHPSPLFQPLHETIARFDIPREPFARLIEANRRDQRQARYETFSDLLDYCAWSANPVGHLYLYLLGHRDAESRRLADCTCTALQLTNFWQDVALDLQKDRVYLPQADMAACGYSEDELRRGEVNAAFVRLLRLEIDRTRALFSDGLRLLDLLEPLPRRNVLLFSLGGLWVLEGIERAGYDVFRRRPRLSRAAKLYLTLKAFLGVTPRGGAAQ